MKRIILKSDVSIYKDSKSGYLDKRIAELPTNEVVDMDTFVTLLTRTSHLFNLLLLIKLFQHIKSEISIIFD